MQKIKNNLFYILLIILPLIDIITSLCLRFTSISISPSLIIRGIFIASCVFYIIIQKDLKYRSLSLIFYFLTIVYFLIYLLTKLNYLNISSIIYEISSLIKFWYFPTLIIFFLNTISSKKLNLSKLLKVIDLNLLIFSLGIIIPMMTNTAFNSYNNGKDGIVGWFYAANEIGALISILFAFEFLDINKERYIEKYILSILAIISLSLIGTKVVTFSLIIVSSIALIVSAIKNKFNLKNKDLIYTTIIFLVALLISNNSSTVNNVLNRLPINIEEKKVESNTNIDTSNKPSSTPKKEDKSSIFSGRDKFLKRVSKVYFASDFKTKLIGLGFVNENNKNNKLIEMDIFDILFNFGIIGTFIYFIPLIYVTYISLKNLLKGKIISSDIISIILYIGLIFGISSFAGHVLGAPAVSIYLAILICLLYYLSSKERKITSCN